MEIIILSLVLLLGMFFVFAKIGTTWSSTQTNFLFANRTLQTVSSGMAINSHWFWAIAIFVGPAVAYNWGYLGVLWFTIPNALSLIVAGFLIKRIRDGYTGYSLTEYMSQALSPRMNKLFQLDFVLIAFAALLLAFTAINKLWAYTQLATFIEPIYASLGVGLITLLFTVRGGIRTSIFSGATQTALWLVFLASVVAAVVMGDLNILSTGKNNLTSLLDPTFITTFAVAWFIPVMVGASSHGMMWQKGFSMPKDSIIPSFSMAALLFTLITGAISFLGMVAFANGFDVGNPENSQMFVMNHVLGSLAVVVFGTILVGQTSTVIDSALNYFSSLASIEWLKKDDVASARWLMVAFMILAWAVSWFKIEIWTIVMLMGVIRVVMFVPLMLNALGKQICEKTTFYVSILTIAITFYLSYLAKVEKNQIYNMYSVLVGFFLPLVTITVASKLRNDN